MYAARTLARDLMAEMRRAGYEPNFWVFRNFYFYYAGKIVFLFEFCGLFNNMKLKKNIVHDSVHKARTLLYGPLATIPVRISFFFSFFLYIKINITLYFLFSIGFKRSIGNFDCFT